MAGPFQRDLMSGMRGSIPLIIASAPFGMLFGALAVDNGMTLAEAVLSSTTIFAGASQMVGIELFNNHTPAWVIVLSIFAVNFRHVLYSAAVGRRIGSFSTPQKAIAFFLLIDPVYAEVERRGEMRKPVPFAWYLGISLPVYLMWICETFLGAVFGNRIQNPEAFGLDFLLPLYFLALVLGFRSRPNWLPIVMVSAVISVFAYHFIGSPWHVSVGALAGILVAALIAKPEASPMAEQAAGDEA